jgi:ABC-type Co2+ transport system permease subunit
VHVSDGVLPPAVWGPGLAAAGAAVVLASRRLDEKRIPEVAVLTAVFFVAALVHVPVPPTSIHLSLAGLLGIVLGWLSLPAVFVALLLQRVFLGHGGLSTLGVNTLTMGAGCIASWLVFLSLERHLFARRAPAAAFIASAVGSVASAAVFVLAMALGGEGLLQVALLCLVPSLLLAVVEGAVTASTVAFLLRAKPELVPGFDRRRSDAVSAPRARAGAGAAAVVLIVAVLAPATASAHDLEARARISGGQVEVEAFFSDGTPVAAARVTVTEAPAGGGSGGAPAIVAEGRTDAGGRFEFVPARHVAHVVVIQDSLGHRTEMEIPAPSLGGESGAATGETIASTGEALSPAWLRVAAGLSAIAVLAAGAYAALRWRRPRGP